jgi:hypothetical protein
MKTARLAALLAFALAPSAAAADGASILFAKGAGKLSAVQQREIFAALGLAVSSDGSGLVDGVCGERAGTTVEFRDMNGDGKDEVLVLYGNTCLSGMAGSSVALFVPDAAGKYHMQLGFPGIAADPKPEKSKGYPDLVIGGPGFCFPVWRWNGKAYAFLKNEPQEPGGCDEVR